MPEFVAYIGAELMMSGIAEAAGAFILSNAAAIATGSMLIGSAAMSASARRQARAQYNAAQVDRLVTVSSAVAPRELVLGRVRKAGTVFFKGSTSTNNTKFVMCVALASHEIDAVEAIYLNDVEVALDGSGNVTTAPYAVTRLVSKTQSYTGNSVVLSSVPVDASHVTVTWSTGSYDSGDSGPLAFTLVGSTVTTDASLSAETKTVSYQTNETTYYANVRSYLGTPGQTADATLISQFPTLWTADHQARGVAYLICEFNYDETAFPSGLPSVSARIRGAKLYDPRTGTTAWSENPALQAREVLIHPQFGKRASLTVAEDARIAAAANACDASTVYTVAGVAQPARALYTSAIVIPFGTTARDALDDIVQAMAGQWAYAAGEFHLRAGAYTASVMTLTDADLAVVQRDASGSTSQSPVQITTHRARDQMFNTVSATIWDSAQDYKQTALTPLKAAALITRDGAELVQDVTLSAVGYAPQALHIAGIMLRDARDPLTASIPFKLSAYPLELFDVISLTLARYGWSAKPFMILGREWTGDGSIRLQLKEVSASTYTMDAEFSAQGGAVNTSLPSPWAITAPTITSTSIALAMLPGGSWINNITVSLAAQTNAAALAGNIELQWSWPGGAWQTLTLPGTETSAVIPALTEAGTLILRARSVTTIAVSGWSDQVTLAVPAPAAVIANYDVFGITTAADGTRVFVFGYSGAAPVYLAGAMLRYVSGSVSSPAWDTMAVFNVGPITSVPYESSYPAAGTYTFGVRAMASDGTLSTTTLYTTVTLAAPPAPAELLLLSSSALTLMLDAAGSPVPSSQTITFTATLQNLTGTVSFSATGYDSSGTSTGAVTLSGTGNTRTLSQAQFLANSSTVAVAVTATLGARSTLIRVVAVKNGAAGSNGTNGTNGVNGTRTAVLDMYQWAATAPTTFPSGASTYTWATGAFTAPATLNGWSLTPPASVLGQTLWIARTVYADSGTAATTVVTWSATTARALGAAGVNGTRTAVLELYQWAASTPTTFPSGTSTYTWATGAFTAPATLNSWALTPGAPVAGQTLYGCSVTYSDTGTTATSTVTWSTSTAYAVGAAGSNGASGARGSLTGYGSNYSISSSTWSDAQAQAVIWNMINGTTLTTQALTTHLRLGDTVTLSNGSTFSATKYWGGSSWLAPGVVIDGNLLVGGTVSASKINSGTFSGASIDIGSSAGGSVLQVSNNGTVVNYRKLSGYNIYAGSLADPGSPAIYGTASAGSEGVYGDVPVGNTNASAHGVRGFNHYRGSGAIVGGGNGWNVYCDGTGSMGDYGTFTGGHDALKPLADVIAVGDIVVDVAIIARGGISNVITSIAVSSGANQTNVMGIYCGSPCALTEFTPNALYMQPEVYYAIKHLYDYCITNGVGEGQINVCGEGGDINAGDLIVTSSTPGKGMRQSDDIYRTCTVAQSRETVTFSSPSEIKQIACFYRCG